MIHGAMFNLRLFIPKQNHYPEKVFAMLLTYFHNYLIYIFEIQVLFPNLSAVGKLFLVNNVVFQAIKYSHRNMKTIVAEDGSQANGILLIRLNGYQRG